MQLATFRERLAGDDLSMLASDCIDGAPAPFVFNGSIAGWDEFREYLSNALGAPPDAFAVVGSAKFGYSLKPDRNFKVFSDTSDIDLVAVHEIGFDALWTHLLKSVYPRPPDNTRVAGWLNARQKEVYTGWLTPLALRLDRRIFGSRIDPILEANLRWFEALKVAARLVPKAHERINVRLYRSRDHALLYHRHSLIALKASLENLE